MSDLGMPDALKQEVSLDMDPSLSAEERRFYIKAYPNVDIVVERKVHCTVCKMHIGVAPMQEPIIKMHPILRVTHCMRCHDFYNSGEFSKGEDGSELYCRWCGQGGEVYCCSNCPYVFCKSCIMKNLSRGVVTDIERNENWSCFSCSPKIIWPLRAQHWALINYIDKEKKKVKALNLSEVEEKIQMARDCSTCCRLAKAKCGNMSDSMDSLDSEASRRSINSAGSSKKPYRSPAATSQSPPVKRMKSNDEVVCTPDLLSMLEPDCQITVSPKLRAASSTLASTPKVLNISGFGNVKNNSTPPPLVLRNTAIHMRPIAPTPLIRRTVVGSRTPTPSSSSLPVYHTINGYRIDLNTAAQQDVFRLPNGKLIQVKRQGTIPQNVATSTNSWQQRPPATIIQQHSNRPVQIAQITTPQPYQTVTVQQQQTTASNNIAQQHHPQTMRYHNTTVTPISHNGTQIQLINSAPIAPVQTAAPVRPLMVRHIFPETAIGQARSQLQDQIFNAMEICQHLTGKIQTLTNSNAYKQARNYLEVKELYIHLSYLLTYAIGRYKGLQDKCLADMRQLGFVTDADSLENGQLAADKQASDDEDNEIEIVEPKTDTIDLDSDNDEESSSSPKQTHCSTVSETLRTTPNVELISTSQTLLTNMLEVDLTEGDQDTALSSPGSGDSAQKKQPRKKTTNKPNPTLLKQKEILERERFEEIKRNDLKLKMACSVQLQRAEDIYPFAKQMLKQKEEESLSEDESDDKNITIISINDSDDNEIIVDKKETNSSNNSKQTGLATDEEQLEKRPEEDSAIVPAIDMENIQSNENNSELCPAGKEVENLGKDQKQTEKNDNINSSITSVITSGDLEMILDIKPTGNSVETKENKNDEVSSSTSEEKPDKLNTAEDVNNVEIKELRLEEKQPKVGEMVVKEIFETEAHLVEENNDKNVSSHTEKQENSDFDTKGDNVEMVKQKIVEIEENSVCDTLTLKVQVTDGRVSENKSPENYENTLDEAKRVTNELLLTTEKNVNISLDDDDDDALMKEIEAVISLKSANETDKQTEEKSVDIMPNSQDGVDIIEKAEISLDTVNNIVNEVTNENELCSSTNSIEATIEHKKDKQTLGTDTVVRISSVTKEILKHEPNNLKDEVRKQKIDAHISTQAEDETKTIDIKNYTSTENARQSDNLNSTVSSSVGSDSPQIKTSVEVTGGTNTEAQTITEIQENAAATTIIVVSNISEVAVDITSSKTASDLLDSSQSKEEASKVTT